jgi:hypothetical protein
MNAQKENKLTVVAWIPKMPLSLYMLLKAENYWTCENSFKTRRSGAK